MMAPAAKPSNPERRSQSTIDGIAEQGISPRRRDVRSSGIRPRGREDPVHSIGMERGANPMRFITGPRLVAASFLALMATGTIAAQGVPAGAGSSDRPAPASDRDKLPADAARVYRYVTTPLPGELRWRQIPWLLDLEEGIRRSKAENRPLLLFVSGDEPLGRC
jgi:hypothetical protein